MRLLLAIVLTMGLTTGCILPIPTPHGRTLEGTEVKQSELAFLQPSVTPKAEVIQRLGQPTILWRDENTLIYRWVPRKGVLLWAVGAGYSGGFGALSLPTSISFVMESC